MPYDNTNTGMMMRNDSRETEKHPEFRGSINIEGVDYWLSAWINEGKPGSKIEGRKYFSLKVSPKNPPPSTKRAPGLDPKIEADDFEDDIPF